MALAATLIAVFALVSLHSETVEASTSRVPAQAMGSIAAMRKTLFPQVAFAGAAAPEPSGAGIGLVDPTSGVWHLRTRGGDPASFYFGNPGDLPIMGDWDCDGTDTPGLYRQADGFVYLRNSNTQGIANTRFFFGNPGDVPLAGDFNNDGCDTVSIYRPSEARIYVINELGENDGGLGAADYSYLFGNAGDKPFTGDFNGNGTTTVGLHRESTGLVYFRNTNSTGNAHKQFFFGDPGDRLVAGDWTDNGKDTPALYRPSDRRLYLRYTNTQGNANEDYRWGEAPYVPVSGNFGALNSGVTVNVSGAPQGLEWAVESFYQDLPSAPHLPTGLHNHLGGLNDTPKTRTVNGAASTANAYGSEVAVVTSGPDVLLAVSDDGWEWRIVGAHPATEGRGIWFGDSPRFVVMIGADWQKSGETWPETPLRTNADSVHIYSAVPATGQGTILGFPRDTIVRTSLGERKVAKTMVHDGPAGTVDALRRETGLPIEGYLHTGMGSAFGGGSPPPGFADLVNAYGGFPFLVPYSGGAANQGDTFVDGSEALGFGRERQTLPHGDIDRTLGQGLLIKAAVAEVQTGSIRTIPGLLSIMDGYVNTDLSVDDVLTLAATIFPIDPGSMPTLTAADLTAAGHTSGSSITSTHGPYNQNIGTLPNVMVQGCFVPWTDPETGQITSGAWRLQSQNYATFADLADGTLNGVPWSC